MIVPVLCSKTLSNCQSKEETGPGGGHLSCTKPEASPSVREVMFDFQSSICISCSAVGKSRGSAAPSKCGTQLCSRRSGPRLPGCPQAMARPMAQPPLVPRQLAVGSSVSALLTSSFLEELMYLQPSCTRPLLCWDKSYPSQDNWNFAERIFALHSWKHSWYY